MRIKTIAGLAFAGAAAGAVVAGGVAYASDGGAASDSQTTVRIIQEGDTRDCPEEGGQSGENQPSEAGL